MDFIVLDKTLRRGSVLIVLTDRFTGEEVTLPVEVKMAVNGTEPVTNGRAASAEIKPIRKAPGRYGFLDLASGDYKFTVESEYFISDEEPIKYLRSEGYKEPTVITLDPTAAYPFPPGTTLLRGVVIDAAEKPVKLASVSVVERSEFRTKTNDEGEFAIFFKGLEYSVETNKSDFYKSEDGDYYVIPKGGSGSDIDLTVEASSDDEGTGKTTGVKVVAEKTNSLPPDDKGKPKKLKLVKQGG